MENKIEELECRMREMLEDPWRILLDDAVREYIRKNYPYCGSYDFDLYERVFEEMKYKIKRILMED